MLYFTDECARNMGIWSQKIDVCMSVRACVFTWAAVFAICFLAKCPSWQHVEMTIRKSANLFPKVIHFGWLVGFTWRQTTTKYPNEFNANYQNYFYSNEKYSDFKHCTNYQMGNYAVVVTTILVLNSTEKEKYLPNGGWNLKKKRSKNETIPNTQMHCRVSYWTRKILFGDIIVSL